MGEPGNALEVNMEAQTFEGSSSKRSVSRIGKLVRPGSSTGLKVSFETPTLKPRGSAPCAFKKAAWAAALSNSSAGPERAAAEGSIPFAWAIVRKRVPVIGRSAGRGLVAPKG